MKNRFFTDKRTFCKYIIVFIILFQLMAAACSGEAEIEAPEKSTELPQIEQTIFTEEQYIKLITGEISIPTVSKEIERAEYFIKPELADENTKVSIYLSLQGYEYCFTPSDEKHAYEMTVFVSDKEYEENTRLIDAMTEKNASFNAEDYEYITGNELECYMRIKNIGGTDQVATFISFMYENHLISVLVLADVSENYYEYCGLEKIYLGNE